MCLRIKTNKQVFVYKKELEKKKIQNVDFQHWYCAHFIWIFGSDFSFSIYKNLNFGSSWGPAHYELCKDHEKDPDSLPEW